MVSPPVPQSVCQGFFLALDENRDGHIDFKELCCGVSAACRGPMAERMKCKRIYISSAVLIAFLSDPNVITYFIVVCFKVFDVDRDGKLNELELNHMAEVLELVATESETASSLTKETILKSFETQIVNGCLSQEDFLIWGVRDNCPSQHFLELLFEVCHVALGLRPQCRHIEYDIGKIFHWCLNTFKNFLCINIYLKF